MKISFFVAAIMIVLLGCSHSDPIDRLMVEVTHEVVPSYLIVPIDLPPTASPEQVVSALSKRGDFSNRKIESYKIVKTRAAQSGPNNLDRYTAVLLDTNSTENCALEAYKFQRRLAWMVFQNL